MKPTRSNAVPSEKASAADGPIRAWTRFWFTPSDAVSLHVVRVAAGLLFLAWLVPLGAHLNSLFGLQGLFDAEAYRELAAIPQGPGEAVGWSLLFLFGSAPWWLTTVYVGAILAGVLFTLGLWPRLTGVLTWVTAVSFMANPLVMTEADVLVGILLFYLMIGYLIMDQRDPFLSPLQRILGPGPERWWRSADQATPRPSLGATLALRLLQVHFAIVMVTTGLHKLQFGDWWGGVALWYPLHRPFETTFDQVRAMRPEAETYLAYISLAAYLVLAWQIGFPLFAWRRVARPLLLGGAIVGWIGAAAVYRLPLWGPALFVCCLSYVTAEEWHRLFDGLTRLPLFDRLAGWLPAAPGERVEIGSRRDETEPLVTAGKN